MTTDNQNSPVVPQGEYPHEQMDAMALDRYKVVPSNASMLWSHAVVAGDGTQQLYVGREVECLNMARKFAGAFLDGAFAFHSMAAAPAAQAAPALEAPAAPASKPMAVTPEMRAEFRRAYREGGFWDDRLDYALDQMLAAAPQAPAVPVAVTTRAELEKLQGGAGSMATIFPADASGFPVRLYAEPAAPAVDANGAVPVVLGKKLFQFSCHQDWVNRAQRAWKMAGVRSEDTICLDQKGRVLRKGLEFARADKEGAFPVVVYLALVDDTAAHDAWLAAQAAAKGASDE